MIPHISSSFGTDRNRRPLIIAVAFGLAMATAVSAADTAVGKGGDGAAGKAADRPGRGLDKLADPLKGTPQIAADKTGQPAEKVLARMLKPRSDSWADWNAPLEPLHRCGEPRALPPCVPPPPCHPSLPPAAYDLVGLQGEPSCGPIYEGPCAPRTGTHDNCPHPHLHRLSDRFFDLFYMWK